MQQGLSLVACYKNLTIGKIYERILQHVEFKAEPRRQIMKKLLINLTIYLSMITLMIADEFYAIEYAGNIAIFAAWFFIVTGFISMLAKPKDLFSRKLLLPRLSVSAQFLMILVMIMIGWTVTGIFYLVAAITYHSRKAVYKNELKKALRKANLAQRSEAQC